jgi:hypothetical protein
LARIPLNTASYGADAFSAVPAQFTELATAWEQRSDHYAMIVGSLSVSLTF